MKGVNPAQSEIFILTLLFLRPSGRRAVSLFSWSSFMFLHLLSHDDKPDGEETLPPERRNASMDSANKPPPPPRRRGGRVQSSSVLIALLRFSQTDIFFWTPSFFIVKLPFYVSYLPRAVSWLNLIAHTVYWSSDKFDIRGSLQYTQTQLEEYNFFFVQPSGHL